MLELNRDDFTKAELVKVMRSDDPELLQELFSTARKIRK